MLKECIEFVKGCKECQKFPNIQHIPESELYLVIKHLSFRGWTLDLIGEIQPSLSKSYKY